MGSQFLTFVTDDTDHLLADFHMTVSDTCARLEILLLLSPCFCRYDSLALPHFRLRPMVALY